MKNYIVLVFILFFLGTSFSYNDICVGKNCLWEKLYEWIEHWLKWEWENAEAITKKDIVENFCKTMYQFPNLPDKSKTSFKTNESIFLKVLCSSIWVDKWSPKFELNENNLKLYNNMIEKAKWKKATWKCINDDWVNTNKESLNNFDFVCFSKSIFNDIWSDFSDMWTFVAFGGYGSDEEKRKKWEKDFFAGKDTWCEDSFLKSNDEEKHYCQHPKTLKYMEEVNQNVSKLIPKMKLIDTKPEEVYDKLSVNKWEDNPWKVMLNIKDKMYQELYYYKLFLSYYSSVIKQYNTTIWLKKMTNNVEDLKPLWWNSEVIEAKQASIVAKKTTAKSLDTIKNIYRTYPIHLWFLSIMEDFDKFRKSLASIYTPFDQLRYKMEQAQDEDKK